MLTVDRGCTCSGMGIPGRFAERLHASRDAGLVLLNIPCPAGGIEQSSSTFGNIRGHDDGGST